MSRETPISISSESDPPIAVTITSVSDSAQTISCDRNPDAALVSEIITVPEEDADQRSDTIEHVDSESDGLEFFEAEEETARAKREEREALEACEGTTCAWLERVRSFRAFVAISLLSDLV